MSVLLKTVNMYKSSRGKDSTSSVVIDDDERISMKLSMGGKSSGGDITLKNAYKKHVDPISGEFKWGQSDTIQIFLKHSDSASDEIDTSSVTDRVMIGDIQEYQANMDENSTNWSISFVDSTYTLLNRLWAKAYLKTENPTINGIVDTTKVGWTPPELICALVNAATATGGSANSSAVKASLAVGTFDSNGKFVRTSGGYVQNVRPNNDTWEDLRGEFDMAKVFKPVYEWFEAIGSTEKTNTNAEKTAKTSVCRRPYIFFIDENNNLHWEYPGTSTDSYIMNVGSDTAAGSIDLWDSLLSKTITYTDSLVHEIKGFKLKRATYDIVNMVIFNAGDDFLGNGILDYFYNPTTKSPTLKPVYKPMTDISKFWKQAEIERGETQAPVDYTENNDTGTLIRDGRKYDASYNFTPVWGTEVTSDSTLNAGLRSLCVKDGDSRSEDITNKTSNPRWKGTITLKGYKYGVGNIIIFNSTFHGIVNAKLRIISVQHSIGNNIWSTTLNVEEDPVEKEGA